MPLNTVPKAGSNTSNTPSKTITKQSVSVAKPSASTARAEALKGRLTGKTPAQPATPRPMGSTARREEMAKLQKFNTPQPVAKPAQPGKTSARREAQDWSEVELPPGTETQAQSVKTVETPQKAAEATAPQPLDPQNVAVIREQQRIRKAQQQLKAEREAWQQEKANYISKDELKTQTLEKLAEAGISYDQLVELQVNQANTSPQDLIKALKTEIAELRSQVQGVTDPEKGVLAQRDNEAYEVALKQINRDAELLVDSDPKYGTIKAEGETKAITELISRVFEEEGEVLDVEEAADLIDTKLRERIKSKYEALTKYEWLKATTGKQAENPAEATNEQQAPVQKTTLTHAGSSTRPLSPREKAVLAAQRIIDARKGK